MSAVHDARPSACSGAASYEFLLFGRFVVRSADEDTFGFEGRRAQELLAYLVLFPERAHHREVLADRLWGTDSVGLEPKRQLRQALWQLRLALRSEAARSSVLRVEGEWLQLNRQVEVWADVWQLEEAFSETSGVHGENVNGAQVQRLRRAVDLYRADLLEGWYSDWCHYERERLKTVYLTALDKLLGYCEAHGLSEEGLLYGDRILAHDRAHERTHWRMMRLHQLAGDRTRALRQFDRCAIALREELAMEPSGSMLALRERIRGDRCVTPAPR